MNRQTATDWATAHATAATDDANRHRSRLVAATAGHPTAKHTDPGTLARLVADIAEAEGTAATFTHFAERLAYEPNPAPAAAFQTSQYADRGPTWDAPTSVRAAWLRGATAAAGRIRAYVHLETSGAFDRAATPPAGTRVIDLTDGRVA